MLTESLDWKQSKWPDPLRNHPWQDRKKAGNLGKIPPNTIWQTPDNPGHCQRTHPIPYQSARNATTHWRHTKNDNKELYMGQWHSVHPRILMEYMYKPLNEGGLNLLNIKAQNEAIELIWLRDYLNLSLSRQTWATVTDILINATTPPGTSAVAVINSFLQSWNTPTRGPRLVTLNRGITRMLSVAKKYNTNLAAIRLSPGVWATLPTWYHPCMDQHPITNVNTRCLLTKHATRYVADLIKCSEKARRWTATRKHTPNQACICLECALDRCEGCRNPHACALEAESRLKDPK